MKRTIVMKQYSITIFWLLTAIAILTACNGKVAVEPTPVSVQFNWIHTVEYSGFQLADRNDYYTEENLVVELRPVVFDDTGNFTGSIDAVVSGQADFGVTGSDALMTARAEGKPIIAVAAIFQRSPNALVSLATSNITHPRDLVGKTVSLSGSGAIYLYAVLENAGIANSDIDRVNIVERTDFTTGQLVSGKVDALDAFLTNEPVTLAQQGIAFNTMVYADYGVDGYANVIFVTEDTLKNRAELVESFLRATFRGYQTAINDPELAARLSVEYNADLTYENELASMRISIPLLSPSGSQVGMMRPEVWQIGFEVLRDGNVLDNDYDVNQSYTLLILNSIYQDN
jgi:NitT/TauT family transport system substrate-binding protein